MWAAARTVSERLSMTAAQDVRVTRRPTAWAADALRVRSWVGRPRPGALERTGTTDPSSRRVASAAEVRAGGVQCLAELRTRRRGEGEVGDETVLEGGAGVAWSVLPGCVP